MNVNCRRAVIVAMDQLSKAEKALADGKEYAQTSQDESTLQGLARAVKALTADLAVALTKDPK